MTPKLGLIFCHEQTRRTFLFCNFLYVCVHSTRKAWTQTEESAGSRKAPGVIKIETLGVYSVEPVLLKIYPLETSLPSLFSTAAQGLEWQSAKFGCKENKCANEKKWCFNSSLAQVDRTALNGLLFCFLRTSYRHAMAWRGCSYTSACVSVQ